MDVMTLKFLQFTEKTWQPLPGSTNPYCVTVLLNYYTDCMYPRPRYRQKPWIVPHTGHNNVCSGRNTREYFKRFRTFLNSLPEPDFTRTAINSDEAMPST